MNISFPRKTTGFFHIYVSLPQGNCQWSLVTCQLGWILQTHHAPPGAHFQTRSQLSWLSSRARSEHRKPMSLGWKESNFPEENPQINQAAMREIELITVNTVVVLHADHSVLLSMEGFPTLFPGNPTWQLDTRICRWKKCKIHQKITSSHSLGHQNSLIKKIAKVFLNPFNPPFVLGTSPKKIDLRGDAEPRLTFSSWPPLGPDGLKCHPKPRQLGGEVMRKKKQKPPEIGHLNNGHAEKYMGIWWDMMG